MKYLLLFYEMLSTLDVILLGSCEKKLKKNKQFCVL